jgi:hypothetical protein
VTCERRAAVKEGKGGCKIYAANAYYNLQLVMYFTLLAHVISSQKILLSPIYDVSVSHGEQMHVDQA